MGKCGVLKKVDYFSTVNMSNSSKTTDPKPLNKLFKNSFKKELIQKIEAGLSNGSIHKLQNWCFLADNW